MDGRTANPSTTSPIPIGVPLPAKSITVTAFPSNTGLVAVGHEPTQYDLVHGGTFKSDGPDATNYKGAYFLSRGESITLECKAVVSEWWLSVATADNGVGWTVTEEGGACGCSP